MSATPWLSKRCMREKPHLRADLLHVCHPLRPCTCACFVLCRPSEGVSFLVVSLAPGCTQKKGGEGERGGREGEQEDKTRTPRGPAAGESRHRREGKKGTRRRSEGSVRRQTDGEISRHTQLREGADARRHLVFPRTPHLDRLLRTGTLRVRTYTCIHTYVEIDTVTHIGMLAYTNRNRRGEKRRRRRGGGREIER